MDDVGENLLRCAGWRVCFVEGAWLLLFSEFGGLRGGGGMCPDLCWGACGTLLRRGAGVLCGGACGRCF